MKVSIDEPSYFTLFGIAVYKTGEGDPLVVILGGPGALSRLYRRYLSPLSAKRTLIFWDYRGTGRSKKLQPYGFGQDHRDLEEVIQSLHALKISI